MKDLFAMGVKVERGDALQLKSGISYEAFKIGNGIVYLSGNGGALNQSDLNMLKAKIISRRKLGVFDKEENIWRVGDLSNGNRVFGVVKSFIKGDVDSLLVENVNCSGGWTLRNPKAFTLTRPPIYKEPEKPKQEFENGDRVEVVEVLDKTAQYQIGDKGTWENSASIRMDADDGYVWLENYTFKLIPPKPEQPNQDFKNDDRVEIVEVLFDGARCKVGMKGTWVGLGVLMDDDTGYSQPGWYTFKKIPPKPSFPTKEEVMKAFDDAVQDVKNWVERIN